ncbi:hypothetical protein HPP92_025252 [Vanilla planifolia]|uniref:Uncharacterized protein n=1 Tax=Vanilla planifolia TaxID=51239 RepID=A0A835PMB8_VANPL|nr:hypothetical protein HPP92_025252 [Vanilla planifolia]
MPIRLYGWGRRMQLPYGARIACTGASLACLIHGSTSSRRTFCTTWKRSGEAEGTSEAAARVNACFVLLSSKLLLSVFQESGGYTSWSSVLSVLLVLECSLLNCSCKKG